MRFTSTTGGSTILNASTVRLINSLLTRVDYLETRVTRIAVLENALAQVLAYLEAVGETTELTNPDGSPLLAPTQSLLS